jgi:hypothetical protein
VGPVKTTLASSMLFSKNIFSPLQTPGITLMSVPLASPQCMKIKHVQDVGCEAGTCKICQSRSCWESCGANGCWLAQQNELMHCCTLNGLWFTNIYIYICSYLPSWIRVGQRNLRSPQQLESWPMRVSQERSSMMIRVWRSLSHSLHPLRTSGDKHHDARYIAAV